ncbi:MAG: Nif3-like dinuclear metal center hexameric protein [Bdellovibrionales bacterium RIFOXYD1_FULL_53_11]|nr:MAG: Nif3-like dinuclear metal center hexameric protein [Bdellovibrionales bacterium RIFOXYD1_FULL_53_11]
MSKAMMPSSVSRIIQHIEANAPPVLAEEWDNTGLMGGAPGWKTSGAVVALDFSEEAVAVAAKCGFRLIITHHPCIFPSVRAVPAPLAAAIRRGIAVYACHTNFDRSALEALQMVSEGLGIKPVGRLFECDGPGGLYKLSVFVPGTHLDVVRDALTAAGAGRIGQYDSCTFSSPGEGTFRGNENTDPFIGKSGKLEKAAEFRLETIIPRALAAGIVQAILKVHPYEEVAYDLYPVEQRPASAGMIKELGMGFWGEFGQPKPFSYVSRSVNSVFKLDGYRVSTPLPARIKKIAFVPGNGASFVKSAQENKCDLFITGEVGYHKMLDAARCGMTVMEIGHGQSERFFLPVMAGWLKAAGLKTVCLNNPLHGVRLAGV